MLHAAVYELFKSYFPSYAENTRAWFQNGRNSIKIRNNNGQEYVFTYYGEKGWCFETVNHYIMRLKGEK